MDFERNQEESASPPPIPLPLEQETSSWSVSADPQEEYRRRVREQMASPTAPVSKSGQNARILLITLGLFAAAAVFSFSVFEIALLVLVLFVHEGGHYLGMKLFGFRDVKMFFIPFLGAAVSSRDVPNAAPWKRLVVVLLGPLPGIVLGIGLMFLHAQYSAVWLQELIFMLLVLNLFNLLPVYPLDGGRIIDEIFFSRLPRLKFVYQLACFGLVLAAGLYLQETVLSIFGGLMLLGQFNGYKRATVVGRIRRRVPKQQRNPAVIPEELLDEVIEETKFEAEVRDAAGQMEYHPEKVQELWQEAVRTPPGLVSGAFFLMIYVAGCVVGLVATAMYVAQEYDVTEESLEAGLLLFNC